MSKSKKTNIGTYVGAGIVVVVVVFVIVNLWYLGNKPASMNTNVSSTNASIQSPTATIPPISSQSFLTRDDIDKLVDLKSSSEQSIKLSVKSSLNASQLSNIAEFYLGKLCPETATMLRIYKGEKEVYTGVVGTEKYRSATQAKKYCILKRSEYSDGDSKLWVFLKYSPDNPPTTYLPLGTGIVQTEYGGVLDGRKNISVPLDFPPLSSYELYNKEIDLLPLNNSPLW